jgi:hypothetical protein
LQAVFAWRAGAPFRASFLLINERTGEKNVAASVDESQIVIERQDAWAKPRPFH